MAPMAKMVANHLTRPSVHTNNKPRTTSFLIGYLNKHNKQLSSTYFRNFLELFVYAEAFKDNCFKKDH